MTNDYQKPHKNRDVIPFKEKARNGPKPPITDVQSITKSLEFLAHASNQADLVEIHQLIHSTRALILMAYDATDDKDFSIKKQ